MDTSNPQSLDKTDPPVAKVTKTTKEKLCTLLTVMQVATLVKKIQCGLDRPQRPVNSVIGMPPRQAAQPLTRPRLFRPHRNRDYPQAHLVSHTLFRFQRNRDCIRTSSRSTILIPSSFYSRNSHH